MDVSPWTLLLFALVMTASGFMQSCMGFGYAVCAMSLLPYVMDVRMANLSVSISALVPMMVAIWFYRRDLDRSALASSSAGALLLLPVGLAAFAYLPSDLLVRGTGLAVLLSMVHSTPRRMQKPRACRLSSAGAGAISGFLSGAVGIGGPPIVAYAIRQSWSPGRFKAFILSFLLIQSMAKVLGVAAAGWLTRPVWMFSLIAIPFSIIGGQLGIAAASRLNPVVFRRGVLGLLVLASLGMLLRGDVAASGRSTFENAPRPSVAVDGKLRPNSCGRLNLRLLPGFLLDGLRGGR